MAQIEPQADQAVRDAVEAFLSGRHLSHFGGETVFETRNSRYRVLDGRLADAPDATLVGAEMVGWLVGNRRDGVVGSTWQPGARAVLVDRRHGEHIIVTSTTRVVALEHALQEASVSRTTESTTQSFAVHSLGTPVPPPPVRRSSPVHAPPRPIAARAHGPLPYPSPPPRREPAPQAALQPEPDSMTPFFLSRVTRQGAAPAPDESIS